MKKVSRYARKRNAHPSDRHKRIVALRHTPYCASAVLHKNSSSCNPVVEEPREQAAVEVKEPEIKETEIVSQVVETTEETQTEVKPTWKQRYQMRKERIQASRIAEIDAILGKDRNSLKDLLLHPYQCMVREGRQEISASSVSSLVRLSLTWIVIAVVLACAVRRFIAAQSFSFLRFNFTSTSNLAFRIILLALLCEVITAVVNVLASRFGGNHVSFKRVLAVRSGCWLFQLVGVLLGAVVSHYQFTIGLWLIVAFVVMGFSLNHHAQSESLEIQMELQTLITVLNVFLCTYLVLQWITFLEQPLVSLLLQVSGK